MVVHIIIAGVSPCEDFAKICFIAEYLSHELPCFCYKRIEKNVLEWPAWLCKINVANSWHHLESPIVWKELVMKGSKPYYIGGISNFLEYINSYYNFDLFVNCDKSLGLVENFGQYQKKLQNEELKNIQRFESFEMPDIVDKNHYVVCITGAGCPQVCELISGLLDMSVSGERNISKIYLHDENCPPESLMQIETQCSYIATKYQERVVKHADKIGNALTTTDVLIVLDHIPFDPEKSIGEWLYANMKLMESLASKINASASRAIHIIFANIGPACFNATVLMHSVTTNIRNIVVATSDLGMQVLNVVAETVELSVRAMFCPPVWGFVGINHLVDLKNTLYKYNSFEPYTRYMRIKNSTLNVGCVTPEIRTLEHLIHFDDTIWVKFAKIQETLPQKTMSLNKIVSILDLIRVWLIEPTVPDYIVNLGLLCDGTFGLTFNGAFSQPARLDGREWRPAKEFNLPKDNFMKLPYLQSIAEMIMKVDDKAFPPIEKLIIYN